MKSHFLNLVGALILTIVVLVGYGFWYGVTASKSATVASLYEQIAAKTETISRIAFAKAAIAEIAGDEAVVQNYFVPQDGVVAFITRLESQGQALGTTVDVLSVSTGSKGTQPILILSLSINGTFNAVMRTVGVIEYMPYDLSISGLSLSKGDKNSWNANLNLRVGSIKTATSTP